MSALTLIPCIISGGAGTRLWPVSREALPKPFIRLEDGESLLQKTFQRAGGLNGAAAVLTVTHRDILFRTLDDYRPANASALPLEFILEPFGRNTAPAIAAAALRTLQSHGPEALLLVLPADHLIQDAAAFGQAVANASALANAGWLVTFGIRPTRAETGFGYLERGEDIGECGNTGCKVARFVEKPDAGTARQYLESGRYLWNAGMFCFRVDVLLSELRTHAPDVLDAVSACLDASQNVKGPDYRYCALDDASFAQIPDISVDYALMERSGKVAVVPCELGWTDIGSWRALSELTAPDGDGNRLRGETVLHEVRDCFIQTEHRLVGAVGVQNLIVVDTPDALLIADAERSQDVRFLTTELKKRGHDAYRLHHTVNRPWGTYTVLEEGPRFKIKCILVHPGSTLSLQMHHHRSEHWVVVSGTARVCNGEREFLLCSNESTFIPAGNIHRLSNPGVIDLVVIEVQSGDYLGEDDIVRFEDIYGRVPEKEACV